MIRTYILPFVLIIVSFYIFFKVYKSNTALSIINKQTEITARVTGKNAGSLLYSYDYEYNGVNYSNTERVDKKTYINHIVNDPIIIYIDPDSPENSVIKNNISSLNYLSLNFGENEEYISAPLWLGYVISFLLFIYGIYRIIIGIRKAPKTF
ncbi:MAG: hypothetical protein Kow0068_18530 [Marinilabiliales bacterium]